MRSATGERAVALVESVLSSGPMAATKRVAQEIVDALEREGLLAAGCTCPVGFGQARDPRCPSHGRRDPAHTIEGVRT